MYVHVHHKLGKSNVTAENMDRFIKIRNCDVIQDLEENALCECVDRRCKTCSTIILI